MRNTNFLNEEKYQKIKKGLITVGVISLVVAITFLILGLTANVPEMSDANWFEAETRRNMFFALSFVFGLMIPSVTFFTAFGREINAFSMQQHMPIVKEGVQEITPTIAEAGKTMIKEMTPAYKEMAKEMAPVYGEVAKEVAEGIKEGLGK